MIINNEYLFQFSNIFDGVLKNIYRASQIGESNGFNYKIKFQYVYNIFIMVPVSIYMIYDFSKVYLCSMGRIKNCNENYIVESIQLNGVNANFFRIFYDIAFCLIIFEVSYLGSIDFLYLDDFFDSIFVSYMFSIVGTYLGIAISYLIVEIFAHSYKFFVNIKKGFFIE